MSNDSVGLDALEKALETLGSTVEGPECHGTLSGLLCARGELEVGEWLQLALPEVKAEAGDLLAAEAQAQLEALFRQTSRQLGDTLLDFHPLLPGDEVELEERVAALGDWCQGFLFGMTLGGSREFEALPADSGEIMHDLTALAQAESYELEGGEEDEQAYSDMLEYVRTGVLLINEELHPSKAAPRDSGITYH